MMGAKYTLISQRETAVSNELSRWITYIFGSPWIGRTRPLFFNVCLIKVAIRVCSQLSGATRPTGKKYVKLLSWLLNCKEDVVKFLVCSTVGCNCKFAFDDVLVTWANRVNIVSI